MPTEHAPVPEFFGDIISSYTRADAIRDGVLVPLSPELLADAGLVFPVCVTDTVWNRYIDPVELSRLPGQSVEGRLWDLLWMLRVAIKTMKGGGDRIRYRVLFQMSPEDPPEPVDLISVCGPGDIGEPVITIMLPGED